MMNLFYELSSFPDLELQYWFVHFSVDKTLQTKPRGVVEPLTTQQIEHCD